MKATVEIDIRPKSLREGPRRAAFFDMKTVDVSTWGGSIDVGWICRHGVDLLIWVGSLRVLKVRSGPRAL